MPHPATMFFLLTLGIIFLSWIFDVYGLNVRLPQTGEEIRVQSLLSPEGLRWLLRHVVTNFTGFAPLGLVIVAMFGIGVAQHSGFIDACIRKGLRNQRHNPWRIVLSVIVLGLLSNVVGDAGYIILLPIAATLFHSVGLHPIGGIIVAYVSVSCGYSANILLSTLDPMLAATTQEAADMTNVSGGRIGPLCNYYFFCVSTFLLIFIIYYITRKKLLPSLGKYNESDVFRGYKQLSRKEQRALLGAVIVGVLYAVLILWATFSSWGILRGVNGGLIRSPFIIGILFLLSLGIGLMGMIYGFASGHYRTDSDVIEGLTQPMKLLGVYFVIAFFASQMFACFEYSHLDKCIAIMGANMLSLVRLDNLWILILFILFTAFINLIMVSSTSKWAFMSFIFIPVLTGMGVSPDMTQCAYRTVAAALPPPPPALRASGLQVTAVAVRPPWSRLSPMPPRSPVPSLAWTLTSTPTRMLRSVARTPATSARGRCAATSAIAPRPAAWAAARCARSAVTCAPTAPTWQLRCRAWPSIRSSMSTACATSAATAPCSAPTRRVVPTRTSSPCSGAIRTWRTPRTRASWPWTRTTLRFASPARSAPSRSMPSTPVCPRPSA